MAFVQSYGTGFGYPYGYSVLPATTFAPGQFQSGDHVSQSAAEGSEHAGEEQASQQPVSISGFAAPGGFVDPNLALYGAGFPQYTHLGAPVAGAPVAAPFGYPTVLPHSLVPVAAAPVRRPGYNERLVAWRNRQKAFNRYKKATKEAIKNSSRVSAAHYGLAPTFVPGAVAPTVLGAHPYGAAAYAPYGATYLQPSFLPGAGYAVYDQGFLPAEAQPAEAYPTFGDFSSFSQQGQQQAQEAPQEEPEIRGTQV